MRKLVLDLEDLAVESFEASGAREESGTVQGREGGAVLESGTWCPTNCLSAPCMCGVSESGCCSDPC
jgi:hypothetical protein